VIGFIMLATLTVPMVGMKMRLKPPVRRKLLDPSAWKEPAYTLFAFAAFFGFLDLYIPLFYIQIFAIEQQILSQRQELAFYLLAILNTGSFSRFASVCKPFHTIGALSV